MVTYPEHLHTYLPILEQETEIESDPTLKQMGPKFTDSQTRMGVRMTERFWKEAEGFPSSFPLGLRQSHELFDQLRSDDKRLVQRPIFFLRSSGVSTISLPCFLSLA